jgi:hypothetical protein
VIAVAVSDMIWTTSQSKGREGFEGLKMSCKDTPEGQERRRGKDARGVRASEEQGRLVEKKDCL